MFRPPEASQMTTPFKLQQCRTVNLYGVNKKIWEDVYGVIWTNFKTYGGTETNSNGKLSVEDTGQIVCWYRPDITGEKRLVMLDGTEDTEAAKCYEILGEPENIEQRNMFLKFKVSRIKGGA